MTSPNTIIITGLSGAGKSTALRVLEDAGRYCIDNLPLFLLPGLLQGIAAKKEPSRKISLVMDARDESFPASHSAVLTDLEHAGFKTEIIFLEAQDKALIRRFSQLRRPHPFSDGRNIQHGINEERNRLAPLRARSDLIIDTSDLTPNGLREMLLKRYHPEKASEDLQLHLLSFGYKNGLPEEADLVLDVRFLPNPYWDEKLRPGSGLDPDVASFVLDNEPCRRFLDQLLPLITFLVPLYEKAGKISLTIAVGCTGGRHRSVAVAETIKQRLAESGLETTVAHRETVD